MEDSMGKTSSDAKIPLPLLEEMFGSEVKSVLAKLSKERDRKEKNKSSDLMDILIGHRSADMMLSPLT
jgi:hypothetical protein